MKGKVIYKVALLIVISVLAITACSGGGGGAGTVATAPNAPSTLAAAAASSGGINLTWTDGSDNEDGFKVERSADGSTFTEVGTVTANIAAYSETGLAASTRYYYRVFAYNSTGNSAYSNMADATTQAAPATAPAAPTNLSATAASSTAINLAWTDASNNEEGFKIERGTNGTDFTEIGSTAASAVAYPDAGLTVSSKYYYRVRAINSAGYSGYSNVTNATTPSCDLNCPGPGGLPDAAPFTDYVIDGTQFWNGATNSWTWTVVGTPCDQIFLSTSGKVSYTLFGENTSSLTFRPVLSGDYTVTVTIDTPDGLKTCTFVIHVRAPGLRAELCWDTSGNTDLDLHLHKPGSTSVWFGVDWSHINPDDCFYQTCDAAAFFSGAVKANWGYASTALPLCEGEPDGAIWAMVGSCHDPRLSMQSISESAVPEIISIDTPVDGQVFRVMVHFYGGSSSATKPLVNIYCGGQLIGSYGYPDTVPGFTAPGGWGAGPMWRAVDVTTQVDGSGLTTGCTVSALHPAGSDSGYWVTINDKSY